MINEPENPKESIQKSNLWHSSVSKNPMKMMKEEEPSRRIQLRDAPPISHFNGVFVFSISVQDRLNPAVMCSRIFSTKFILNKWS